MLFPATFKIHWKSRRKAWPTLDPHHNGGLPKRSVDLGRRRDDDKVSLLASDEDIPDPP